MKPSRAVLGIARLVRAHVVFLFRCGKGDPWRWASRPPKPAAVQLALEAFKALEPLCLPASLKIFGHPWHCRRRRNRSQ